MKPIIAPWQGKHPVIPESVFVAPGATVIGDVALGEEVSIWYGVVVRGDVHEIRIGARTNIQDLSMVHCTKDVWPTYIGERCTIGHRVTLHGCTVKDNCLIGMGAIILDGAVVEEGCLIGAGSLVPPGMVVPAGSLVMGSPAKVKRALSPEEIANFGKSAAHYVEYARGHAALFPKQSLSG